ncbi:hypothetical protein ACFE04_010813 [Oxalis oulophora]
MSSHYIQNDERRHRCPKLDMRGQANGDNARISCPLLMRFSTVTLLQLSRSFIPMLMWSQATDELTNGGGGLSIGERWCNLVAIQADEDKVVSCVDVHTLCGDAGYEGNC